MKSVYTVRWTDEPRSIRRDGFDEFEDSVVCYDAEGEERASVSNEHVVAIEPE